jgi:hypothetical protein
MKVIGVKFARFTLMACLRLPLAAGPSVYSHRPTIPSPASAGGGWLVLS